MFKNYYFSLLFLFATAHAMHEQLVPTRWGNVHVYDSQGTGPALVCLHLNSASGKAFINQFNSPLAQKYRLIAISLLGHGKSDNATNPQEAYTLPGNAHTVLEVTEKLGLNEYMVAGWSLGGHIALQLAAIKPESIAGALITGTPPLELSPAGMAKGFLPFDEASLMGHAEQFTQEQAERFTRAAGIEITPATAFMVEDARRADGVARVGVVASAAQGVGNDETRIVATMDAPLAIVAGGEDHGINYKYVSELAYKNLWRNQIQVIPGAGHAAPLTHSVEFNRILGAFARHVFGK